MRYNLTPFAIGIDFKKPKSILIFPCIFFETGNDLRYSVFKIEVLFLVIKFIYRGFKEK